MSGTNGVMRRLFDMRIPMSMADEDVKVIGKVLEEAMAESRYQGGDSCLTYGRIYDSYRIFSYRMLLSNTKNIRKCIKSCIFKSKNKISFPE